MATWLAGLAASVGTLIVTLIVTFIFNKAVTLPNIVKKQKNSNIIRKSKKIFCH